MRAVRLSKPAPIEQHPLQLETVPEPEPAQGQLMLAVRVCGVCHTDLHIAEGDIRPPAYPVTPGHQVVGEVRAVAPGVQGWRVGERAGVTWLFSADGTCEFCRRGDENLCPSARFTGFDAPGGYAEFMVAPADYCLKIPASLADEDAAPLLCAGIIGYRSLRRVGLQPGERLGLAGFGASAHLALQVARHWGCQVSVFTRSPEHRQLALELGAEWAGGADDRPPEALDRVVTFAPVGDLIPKMLDKLRAGGALAINAVHLSPIPELPYKLIYGERSLTSVANLTRQDGAEFLALAAEIPIRPVVRSAPLEAANQVLEDLKHSRIIGSAILRP